MIDKNNIIRRESEVAYGVKIKGISGEWLKIKSWYWSLILFDKRIEINLN